MTSDNTCRCGRPAAPDSECVFVTLGEPRCSDCAQAAADEQDAAEGTERNSAPWETEVELAAKVLEDDGDTEAFATTMRGLGFDDVEISRWISERSGT